MFNIINFNSYYHIFRYCNNLITNIGRYSYLSRRVPAGRHD